MSRALPRPDAGIPHPGAAWSRPLPHVPPSDAVAAIVDSAPTLACFDSDQTRARWDGETLIVRFCEVGLLPGTATAISVAGQGSVDVTLDGESDHVACSEAAASTEAVYPVDADGATTETVPLLLATGLTLPHSVGARTRMRWTFFATTRDLDTGAVAYLTGDAGGELLAT